ncbi:DUF6660 family protein [Pontibacter chitinilyticus]|uniref:DUF6660 family protein n=1 Tax=Pontibacter chitinilyticus TaxID=2674989 RepID=UPI00321BF037
MRLALHILTLLLLTLSLKPCADRPAPGERGKVAIVVADLHQDHQDSGADSCLPFCSCHCCHTHFQPQPTQAVEYASLQNVAPRQGQYQSLHVSSRSRAIWQPPQVA